MNFSKEYLRVLLGSAVMEVMREAFDQDVPERVVDAVTLHCEQMALIASAKHEPDKKPNEPRGFLSSIKESKL